MANPLPIRRSILTRRAPSGGPMIHTPAPTNAGATANPTPVGTVTTEGLIGALGTLLGGAVGGPGGAVIGRQIGEGVEDLFGGGGEAPVPGTQGPVPGALVPRGCDPPLVMDQSGICVFPGSPGDLSTAGPAVAPATPVGTTVFGSAVAPEVRTRTHRRCPKGLVLGVDNLCYRKGDLRRGERKWRPGRKPLLTGGDLNAIAKAERAAKRFKKEQSRLRKLGMLPKASSGSSKKKPSGEDLVKALLAAGVPKVAATVIDTD